MAIKRFQNWVSEDQKSDSMKEALHKFVYDRTSDDASDEDIERYTELFYNRCKEEGIPKAIDQPVEGWFLDDFNLEQLVHSFKFDKELPSGDNISVYIGFFWSGRDEMEIVWESNLIDDEREKLAISSIEPLTPMLKDVSDEDYFDKVIQLVTDSLKNAICEIGVDLLKKGFDLKIIISLVEVEFGKFIKLLEDIGGNSDVVSKLKRMHRGKQAFGM